jgi:hypothetical protein
LTLLIGGRWQIGLRRLRPDWQADQQDHTDKNTEANNRRSAYDSLRVHGTLLLSNTLYVASHLASSWGGFSVVNVVLP